jgi:hypothetical protein
MNNKRLWNICVAAEVAGRVLFPLLVLISIGKKNVMKIVFPDKKITSNFFFKKLSQYKASHQCGNSFFTRHWRTTILLSTQLARFHHSLR